MLDKDNFKNLITYVIIIGLFILAAFIVRPIISSIIYGILLGYIFYPFYNFTLKKLKNKNLSALLVCSLVLLIIVTVVILSLGALVRQLIDIYLSLQKMNIASIIQESFPNFFTAYELPSNIIGSLNSFISSFLAKYVVKFGDFILNIPLILIQLFVVVFIFFFSLRDGKEAVDYIKSLSPFKTEINEKFSKQFKDVTNSVLIGQVVVGVIQGIIAGIGYFIFGVPNALLLTIMTVIVGIIPIIGPWLVWIPADIYLFVSGRYIAGIGLLIYGLFLINWIDTLIRPLIVSRKTSINLGIILIGMMGGLFAFGILGLIIGPLVLAYILLILEIYRKNKVSEDLIFKKVE